MQSNMFELLSHSPCSQRKRQVQSNYQNFRILKSEFLEPPLWLPLSRAYLYIYTSISPSVYLALIQKIKLSNGVEMPLPEFSIEYGRTFQVLFGEYYYSSYRYRLTLSMATLCKASQDFLPNPL